MTAPVSGSIPGPVTMSIALGTSYTVRTRPTGSADDSNSRMIYPSKFMVVSVADGSEMNGLGAS